MLVRGTTPQGEERLARARRLRRAAYVLFFSFLLLVLLAIPFFVSRYSQITPPDDPEFLRRVANPDAVWAFRPGPVAERLFGGAVVPLDLTRGLSTLHQYGQGFVYHPAQEGGAPDWVLVISRRRPQWVYDGALRRLFPLESELDLSLVHHLDRDRLIIASSRDRLGAFRTALAEAGPVPKVEVAVVQEDPEVGHNFIARYRGEWGLLPKGFTDAVVELTGADIAPGTELVVTCDRQSDMIAITYPSNDPSDEALLQYEFSRGNPQTRFHYETGLPWITIKGVALTGEVEEGVSPPTYFDPDGPGRTD